MSVLARLCGRGSSDPAAAAAATSPDATSPDAGTRVVRTGGAAADGGVDVDGVAFPDNSIITSKYTALNIIPKAIWEQFRRVSNFYFLAIAAISTISSISPVSPITTIPPLIVVVGFGMARDIYEDFQRKRQDRAVNNAPVEVVRPGGSVEKVQLRAVKVGDVVRVQAEGMVPADVVPLFSAGDDGTCYVSTSGLDGESSLKRRLVPSNVYAAAPTSVDSLTSGGITVRASRPQPALEQFAASVVVGTDAKAAPMDEKNLLPRGSILRNTQMIDALVIYTGSDTKVALNMRNPPSKLGQIERMLNRVVGIMFFALFLITVAMSVFSAVLQARKGEGQWYMGSLRTKSGTTAGLQGFGTFIILFHTFIPISLFVTLEFVRVIQGIFIYADVKMRSKGVPVTPKAGNLHEVLGSIEHILTDKTGTLTQNVMRFVACSAGGEKFDIRTAPARLDDAVRSNPARSPAYTLIRSMALAHSVVPEVVSGSTKLAYNAQSPDEVALVEAARDYGVELRERKQDIVGVRTFNSGGQDVEYRLLAELEFSSDRKRASAVMEELESGRVFVVTKGADAVMIPLLVPGDYRATLDMHLHEFAVDGLRTLVYGSREIPRAEFSSWLMDWNEASNLLDGRSEKQAELSARLEVGLNYVGCTAVEDKLQDRVPETIQFMRDAGVRIWVLTGDKLETAENIGYSANLLNRSMHVEIVNAASPEELRSRLLELTGQPAMSHRRNSSFSSRPGAAGRFVRAASMRSDSVGPDSELQANNMAIIIEGKSLASLEGDESLEQLFMDVSDRCRTVICARVTPSQKAKMVQMARRWRNATTLAIGDGGNDVSMIQEAHIGVGLVGKEGTQAALASDYSMGEFRHLQRLLTVHGRYSYIRTAGVINLSLYKNITFTTTQILFQFFAFASGPTAHDEFIVTAFNALLTLAGPFLYGLFERDLEESTIESHPSVYLCNRNNRLFSFKTVAEFTLGYSVWHGVACFFGIFAMFGQVGQIALTSGRDSGFFLSGFALSVCVVAVVQFKFFLSSHILNKIIMFFFVVSFAFVFAIPPIVETLLSHHETEGVLAQLVRTSRFHLVWPVIFVAAFFPDFLLLMRRAGILGKYAKGGAVAQLQRMEASQSRPARLQSAEGQRKNRGLRRRRGAGEV